MRKRANRPGVRRSLGPDQFKPEKFAHYLTLGELADHVERNRDYMRRLERQGRLPEAKRHKVGKLSIRLYSPAQVREIETIFSRMRRGRPRVT
jgi:hypothetical protein